MYIYNIIYVLDQRSMALIAQCKAWMVLVDSKIVANLRIQSGSDEERIEILSAIGRKYYYYILLNNVILFVLLIT